MRPKQPQEHVHSTLEVQAQGLVGDLPIETSLHLLANIWEQLYGLPPLSDGELAV